jgi:uncharacterized repeat protein (TIGR03803 family)
MNKLYVAIVLTLVAFNLSLKSQSELWGVVPSGGDGFGSLFSMSTGSTAFSMQRNFTGAHGSSPQNSRLVLAVNGKFYGTTLSGGINNVGVIFEFDPSTNTYIKRWDFVSATGSSPRGPLMQASNGKLYGMTAVGGVNNNGVIFEFDPSTNTYSKKVDLIVANGSGPFGTLMELSPSNGKLYGLTRAGGANGVGVIFEYDLSTAAYTKKIDLSTTLGSNPQGEMVQSGSLLYGLCSQGGTASVGTLIEYDYSTNTCTKKVDFNTATGSVPNGSLLRATDGNLYGLTSAGGANAVGVVFQYSINTAAYTNLSDLSTTNGAVGHGNLVQSSANGKLYGITRQGGTNNQGAIIEFDYTTSTFTKKFDLSTANTAIGGLAFTTPVFGANGNLYGPLTIGGLAGVGTIYEFNISTSTFTKRADFNYAANGGNANGGLVYASNGKLYGTTISGGANNAGVIYEYDRATSTFTKKIDMLSANGSIAYASMIEANNKLYGVSNSGGTNNVGVVFEYDFSTNTYTKKIDLATASGSNPFGHMIESSINNKIYGLTRNGGTNAIGVLFEYDYSTNTYTKKVDMVAASGQQPSGSLVEAPNGKLYGMTQFGGANSQGVIFEYDVTGNTYTKKFDFVAGTSTGTQPFGSLVLANDGNLYGLTRFGGNNSLGTLFRYNYGTNSFTKMVDLSTTTGSSPNSSLVKAANNKLYAPLTAGGTNSVGTIVEYDVALSSLSVLMNLSNSTGYAPAYTRLIEVCLKPANAGAIVASTNSVCSSDASTKNFSIALLPAATSYSWSVPVGASIVSGGLTNNIGVNFGSLSSGVYSYSVAGVNICGTGTLSSATISVLISPTVSVNSGSICSGNSFTMIPSGANTYTFSSGTAIVSPIITTAYSLTGTSSQGCISTNTAISNVTVQTTPTITVNSGSICTGNSFTMIPGGASTYTYSSGSAIVSPLVNTNYTVTGTSALGCVGTNSAVSNVTVNITPTISVNSGSICTGQSFTMIPSGASTYTFSSGTAIVSPLINTAYNLTGTSAQGCVSSNTAISNVVVQITPTVTVNSGSICVGGSFTMVPGGALTYTFSSGTSVVSPLINTSYNVTGTSAQGCVSSNTAISNVTVNINPTISVNSGSICTGNSFTMIPSGASTYTYSSGTAIVSPLTNTNFSVTGTSAQGCPATNTAVSNVTVNVTPTVSVNSGSICSGNSFTMIPGGASTYTYSSGSAIVSPLVNTSYNVTGTSAQGCVSSNTAVSNVTVQITPTITVNSGSICTGNSFTMVPGGASTYTYSSGSAIVSPLINTSYNVTGTSAQGCVASNTAVSNVTVNITPTVSVNSGSICTGNSFTMVPSGASTYTYSSGSAIVSPLVNTSYNVTGTSAQGCVATNTAVSSVTVNITPTVSVNSGSICTGNSFTMIPSGASTYTYSSGSAIVSPLVNTSYNVTGTSAQGCVSSNTAISNVIVNITPTISVNSGSICTGNSFTMVPSGANTYTYSSGSAIVSPLVNTAYNVTGTSAQGCVATNTAVSNVTVNVTPVISVNSGVICSGNSFTIVPSGASTYTYSSGSPIVSPLVNTIYSVTGTSSQGCVASNTAISVVAVNITPTVTVNSGSICTGNSFTMIPGGASTYTYSSGSAIVSPLINTSYSVTGTSALGCISSNTAVSNVTVNITPTITVNSGSICTGNSFTMIPGGASTYTYSSGSAIVSPLINTSYNVTGTSAQGCVGSNTAISNVTVNITPTISVNSGSICTGNSFTMIPGGASTYTYSSGSAIVSPLINTSYNVTGTSAQGCVGSNTAISNVTVNVTPTISVNSGSICTGNSFTMVPGGASTYTFSSGSATVAPLINTSYSVTGTSAQGCVSTNTAVSNVTVNVTPTITVNSGSICTGNSFTMIPGGASTYTYSSGSAIVSPIVNTSYSVTGTSAQGCISNNTAVSNVTANITPTVSVNSGSICTGNSFTMIPGGASTYTYSSGSAIVSPIMNTSYSVTGTSAQGCVSNNTAVSNVTVNINPTITVNSGSICTGNSFVMTPGGASTYTFSSGSNTVSPLITTSYSVTGTSSLGCVSTNTAISNVTVNVTPTITVNSGSICTGNSFTMIPGGASTYTYSSGSAIVSPIVNTSYSVTGTSAQGCISNNTAVSNVTANITPTVSVNSGSICTGNSFTMIPGGASTYTYSSGSAIVSPLINTSYSVIGTSAQGCVATNTAVSNVTANITPIISVNSGTICSTNSFTMIPGGANTYSYSSGSAIVSPLINTSYSVTGTSAQGCISSNTAISNVLVNITPTVSVNSGSICTGNSFTMIPGGANTYTYSSGSAIVSPIVNTSYSVTGTSAQGCVSNNTAVSNITANITPTVSVNSGSICTGNSFTMLPSGASTYTYSSGSAIVSPLINTSYSVTGTSAQGCVATNTAVSNVTVNITPTVSVNNGTICSGNSFTMLPGGANTYTYSSGSSVVSPITSTSFSVTGTSAQGCVSSNTAVSNVTVFATPLVVVNSGSICSGNSFSIIPNGANTYTINGGSFNVSPTNNTSYSITGTSSLGCISSNTAISNVTVIALPVVTALSGSICMGTNFTPTVTGANTYTYSTPFPINPTVSTTYSVIGTNLVTGCVSNPSSTFAVTVNARPSILIAGTNTLCLGGVTTLTASGANTFTWSTTTGPTVALSPTINTTYSVFGTSTAGCNSVSIINVTVQPVPSITVSSGGICTGGSFTLTPNGAINYTYLPNGPIVTPTATTIYTINGENVFGCSMPIPVTSTVTVGNTLSVSIIGDTFVCIGESVNLTANGASSYTWNNGAQTNNIIDTPTTTTTYSVFGESGSCSSTAVVIVTVNPLPNLLIASTLTKLCVNETTTLTATGALTYTWSTVGQPTTNFIVVSPSQTTNYSLTATDINDCINTASFALTVDLCTNLKENQATLNEVVKLYPNPNVGVFFIESSKLLDVKVYNNIGQLIMEQRLEIGTNQIQLNQEARGLYIIKCSDGYHEKFIRVIKE